MQAALSHYRIIEQIDSGGMAVVYRAHDEHLDRAVALKVLSSGTVIDPASRKRFRKEALTLSKLNHPNIAIVHDFGSQDGVDFLVEEFIEGLSLHSVLVSGPLPEKEIIHLGVQLAEGLAAAHDQGIIHRDLKPANIRITPEARLKILDFGLAIFCKREASSTAPTESVSEIKGLSGTLPYMAPEQLIESRADALTDIWATGCVLYEMATGRRPFLGAGPALIDSILHQSPPSVRKLNPNISTALEAVIQKCIDKDPCRRYLSAQEIAVDLRRTNSLPTMAILSLYCRRRWGLLLTLALLVATLGFGLLLRSSWTQSRTGKVSTIAVRQGHIVAHESYLAGLKYLDRWDKPENLESAIRSFEQAVKADPSFALGFSALAEAYWARYRIDSNSQWLDKAEENCTRALQLNDQLPAVYVTFSRIQNGRGRYNVALQEIQRALKLEPHDPGALLAQAGIYGSTARQQEAESIYKTATALRPQDWGGYYEMGVFYYREQRYADAAAAFERALEITPDNALVHATLGAMLQMLGKDVEAEQHLGISLRIQPSYAAYTNLGVLYYGKRQWAESAAMTEQALRINPEDWKAWSNLRLAYEWLKRKSQADDAMHNELTRLEQIARSKPDDADVQSELGVLYSKQKLSKKAITRIEAALALAPEDPFTLSAAGEAYDNLGDRTRALELVQKALQRGLTIAQLQRDPGQQNLILDPRFPRIAQQFTK